MTTYRSEGKRVIRCKDGKESLFATAETSEAASLIAERLSITATPVAYVEAAKLKGLDRYGRKNVELWDSPSVGGEDVPLFAGRRTSANDLRAA